MARTTASAVAGIIETDATIIVVVADMDAFLETANELVTEVCVTNGPTTPYTAARLELIERWLTAHFYAIRDPRATDEKAGPVSARFESKVDLGLALTRYGQQAKLLDTNGGLAALDEASRRGSPRSPSLGWLGTAAT